MRSDPLTTDGWRGRPGPEWSEVSVAGILTGLAESGVLGPSSAIAFDGRAGSRELALLGSDVLSGLGVGCVVGDEPSPTPALGIYVRDNPEVTSGITFTASHNPPGYFGMKLRDAEGLSCLAPPSEPVAARIPSERTPPDRVAVNAGYAATVGRDLLTAAGDFDGHVVIDAAHGALGALSRAVPGVAWSRSRPLPFFGGVTPDPVAPENVVAAWHEALRDTRRPERLLMAFSDGDGDRLVLATARSGYIGSAEQAAIACRAGLPVTRVIATVVTPRMVRRTADSCDLGWSEVPVGFKHVVAAWRAEDRPSALGLEPNGALAYALGGDDYFERDALRALTLIIRLYPSVAAIDDVVARLRAEYPGKPELMTSPEDAEEVLRRLSGVLGGWESTRNDLVASLTQDGWRVLVRPSGTESATRIYVEAPSEVTDLIRNALHR